MNESQNLNISGSLGCLAGIYTSTRLERLSAQANEYLKQLASDTKQTGSAASNGSGQIVYIGLPIVWGVPENLAAFYQNLRWDFPCIDDVYVSPNECAVVTTLDGKKYIPISTDSKKERVEYLVRQKKAGVIKWISTLGRLSIGQTYIDTDETIYPEAIRFLTLDK